MENPFHGIVPHSVTYTWRWRQSDAFPSVPAAFHGAYTGLLFWFV